MNSHVFCVLWVTVHYAIFETGPHHAPGATARLTSPTMGKNEFSTTLCFTFTYAVSTVLYTVLLIQTISKLLKGGQYHLCCN